MRKFTKEELAHCDGKEGYLGNVKSFMMNMKDKYDRSTK